MSDWQFSTPVVFIIFNRPDTTARVFAEIAKAKPPKLLVVADGPRKNKQGEAEKCAATRAIINQVDWPCEVLTNYSDVNLGCKNRVSSGLNWVFEQVEEAIILEDDCLPDPTFFRFCEDMLLRYSSDSRIMMVCGTNYLLNVDDLPESYFFSNYYPIWGWATWRRAWKSYDIDMNGWELHKQRKQLEWIYSKKQIADYYEAMFGLIRNGFNTWDIQWWFACIFQHGLSIVPRGNLISNIGATGTHTNTQGNLHLDMPTYPFNTNVIHPKFIIPDAILNKLIYEQSHANLSLSVSSLMSKKGIKWFLKTILPRRAFLFLRNFKSVI